MPVVYWATSDLLADPKNNEKYRGGVNALIDALFKDDNLGFSFKPVDTDKDIYIFVVYGESSLPLISSIQGDVWKPGFKSYLVDNYGSNHRIIIDLVKNDSENSALRYIFQELMREAVRREDEFSIEEIDYTGLLRS